MSLPELEKEYIRSLTRKEKWQIIKDIQKMLQQEERAEEEGDLRKIFKPGTVYEIATPSLAHDGNDDFWTALTAFRQNTASEGIEITDSDFEMLRSISAGRETDWS